MCYPRWNALPIVWIITLKITIPGFFGITVVHRIDNPFRLLQREACMKCIFFCFRWYNHQGGLDRLQDVLHSRRYRRHCYVQRGGGHISQRRFILWRDMPPHQCEVHHTTHTSYKPRQKGTSKKWNIKRPRVWGYYRFHSRFKFIPRFHWGSWYSPPLSLPYLLFWTAYQPPLFVDRHPFLYLSYKGDLFTM